MRGIYPVIFCGGGGTRLWPLSRAGLPKPYLRLRGQHTLVQSTALRAQALGGRPPIFVASVAHRHLLARQLDETGIAPRTVLLEPRSHGTAAAAIAAASHVGALEPAGIVLLMPSDHQIEDTQTFRDAVRTALPAARDGALVTFGITPAHADTGYGYIEPGDPLCHGVLRVRRFVEKPDIANAGALVADGRHYWNSGMLLFRADAFLDEAERLAPHIAAAASGSLRAARRTDGTIVLGEMNSALPEVSLDRAIMEKTGLAAVVPADMGWKDIGGWSAVYGLHATDVRGNVVSENVLTHDVENSFIRANGALIAAVGVRNLVIVGTEDAILIADRDAAQDVRHIVSKLQEEGRSEACEHVLVERPWGSYQVIDSGDGFQVKRIIVHPGQRLSLQMHHKRAEHWTVVRGTARVTCGERTFDLKAGEATEIPLGARHRLENIGDADMQLIEVQTGSYLGEDDIVRFEDNYGRAQEPR